jgi:hypothetical protein
MRCSLRHFLFVPFSIALLCLCVKQSPVTAQAKKGPAPIAASPQAPTINFPSPSGARRGTSVEVKLTGTNLAGAVAVWTSFPAKATIPTDAGKGADATKMSFKLEVPADAPIGFHTLRVATKNGVSNAQVFCIDDLPQVVESETNHFKSTAQVLPTPCVVLGKIELESSDFFKISVRPGQRLTFEVLGRRLGSLFDPMLLLHDAKTGRELPGLYSDDAPGLQSDARFTHTFKEGGDFLIELRDTTHRGGPDFNYRLRIGDFPAALTALPLALKRGTKAKVGFTGPAIDGVAPVELTAPMAPAQTVIYATPKGPSGLCGWPVPVLISDFDEIAETEPNNDAATANKLSVPGGVTGRFQSKGDIDVYSFVAKKGTKYIIAAETYEINSPAEVYLVLKDAKNADLGKSVPTAPSARIEFTAAADGPLFIHAEHLNYAHGPNEVYHLTVRPGDPDFDVNLGIDRFEVAPGGFTLIPVTSVVRRDYTGPIELSVSGPAGLTGTITIPGGGAAPPAGQPLAYLPLSARTDLPMGAYDFRVLAKATANGKEVVRPANVTDLVKTRMAGLAFPPRDMLTALSVGVTDKPLFALAAKGPVPEITRGLATNIALTATRMGVADEITLTPIALPANVTATAKPIAKGASEGSVQITAAAGAAPGPVTLWLRTTFKAGGKDFAAYATPITLVIQAQKANEKPKEKEKEKKEKGKDKQ